jgi:hypothetical protein
LDDRGLPALHAAAVVVAQRVAISPESAARWVGKDARLRAPASFDSEEDGVGGVKARVEASSLPVIVGGLLGLMLAAHVFRNYRFIR